MPKLKVQMVVDDGKPRIQNVYIEMDTRSGDADFAPLVHRDERFTKEVSAGLRVSLYQANECNTWFVNIVGNLYIPDAETFAKLSAAAMALQDGFFDRINQLKALQRDLVLLRTIPATNTKPESPPR